MIHVIPNLSMSDVGCNWKMQKAPKAVKSVEEIFPAPRVYHCLRIRRQPPTDDRQWLLKADSTKAHTVFLISTLKDFISCDTGVPFILRMDHSWKWGGQKFAETNERLSIKLNKFKSKRHHPSLKRKKKLGAKGLNYMQNLLWWATTSQ